MTIDDFEARVLIWLDDFNFCRPGVDQSLGRDIVDAVVEGIIRRSHDQKKGAEIVWEKNTKDVAARKEKLYGVADAPNVQTGDMLDQKALEGRTIIEPDKITMIYGRNEIPSRTSTGKPLPVRKRGKKKGQQVDDKTDVEKAYYAHTGQSEHKIKRPFYEVDADISAAVRRIIDEAFEDYIRQSNQE